MKKFIRELEVRTEAAKKIAAVLDEVCADLKKAGVDDPAEAVSEMLEAWGNEAD
jgi:hypothetical protein